jgi:primosomal replication protein N
MNVALCRFSLFAGVLLIFKGVRKIIMHNSTKKVGISAKLVIAVFTAFVYHGVYARKTIQTKCKCRLMKNLGEEQMQHFTGGEAIANVQEEISNACYNRVSITGQAQSFTNDGNGNTMFLLCVTRLSGQTDVIPVTVPFSFNTAQFLNKAINVRGSFASYNKIIGNRSKLILHVLAHEIAEATIADMENPNSIDLTAFVCKVPIYRTTPFNREIADLLLAVNSLQNATNGQSSYIPAIAWGKNARFAKGLALGEKVHINGRIQSREYQKRFDDGTIETRTAYEVSINTITNDKIKEEL